MDYITNYGTRQENLLTRGELLDVVAYYCFERLDEAEEMNDDNLRQFAQECQARWEADNERRFWDSLNNPIQPGEAGETSPHITLEAAHAFHKAVEANVCVVIMEHKKSVFTRRAVECRTVFARRTRSRSVHRVGRRSVVRSSAASGDSDDGGSDSPEPHQKVISLPSPTTFSIGGVAA